MFASVHSVGLRGLETYTVSVEADLSAGLPRFDMVGLPDAAVSESRERVRSAIRNSGLDFPVSRVTINLAPADIRKEGPIYDLPVLIAVLKATGQLKCDTESRAFIGELSLSGEVRRINGVLPMVIQSRKAGFREIYIPHKNLAEGAVVEGISVFPVKTVAELLAHLRGEAPLSPVTAKDYSEYTQPLDLPDFADVKGQHEAKRALEVAAAGGHNVMMIGPPGSGKSMLAKRIPSILPDMTFDEALETTNIYSVAGALPPEISLIRARPFRSPHHTVSPAGLSGGGTVPHSIAVRENSGSSSKNSTPLCAMNPCPCGFFGHPTRKCTCPAGAPQRYLSRVSGPLLDRLDIHIEVPPVDFDDLSKTAKEESSADIKARVDKARAVQQERLQGTGISCNAKMDAALTRKFCTPPPAASALLKNAFEKLGLSARAYDKVLRVARTIADLDGKAQIDVPHIAEAVQYRSLDRKFWKG